MTRQMTRSMPFTARQAHDPSTPPEVLARIAGDRPDLRALVAGNPATEDPVVQWLRCLGDVGVDAALSNRAPRTGSAGPVRDGKTEPQVLPGPRQPETPREPDARVPEVSSAAGDWALLLPAAATPATAGTSSPTRRRRGRTRWLAVGGAVVAGVFLTAMLLQGAASPGSKHEPMTGRNGAQEAPVPRLSGEPRQGAEGAPFTYGDDRRLDELWQACDRGDPDACVDLYAAAPVDSEYERFGWTCGGRAEEGLLVSDVCSGVV